jgi:hypothetical protein
VTAALIRTWREVPGCTLAAKGNARIAGHLQLAVPQPATVAAAAL